jgi:hypothetical protein
MKAIRFHEYGVIDVLRYEETPTPPAREWRSARCRRGDGVQPGGHLIDHGSGTLTRCTLASGSK